ncbi:MAG: hypothetical protein L0Z53_06820 [Acidobacteriales bacterium]|nr:hypothetical protein [Terriglobales bacterium]
MTKITYEPVTPTEKRNRKYEANRHNEKQRAKARKNQARYQAEGRYSKEHLAARRRAYYDTWKTRAFMWHGGRCERCGNNDMRVLQLDHVNNDGRLERRHTHLVRVFKRAMLEAERYKLLCANCHVVRHWEDKNGPAPSVVVPKFKDLVFCDDKLQETGP